jgi:hypothetical protein
VQVNMMATVSMREVLVENPVERSDVRRPAALVGLLLARSVGLAAGVAVMSLLAAALFSIA